MANNVNVKVGYTIDKNGLNELKRQLTDIRLEAAKAKLSGNLKKDLQEASDAASKLEDILDSAWNSKINQLDLSKVNTGIKNTYHSVENLQKALVKSGSAGATAYNNFAMSVLNTDVQLKRTSQTLDKMAITFKNTVRYGISSSIFNNFTNSVQKAYDYTKQLDTSLNDIRIVTGKSAEEMDKFAVRANKVAKDLGRSTKDFTEASLIYYQQGLGNEEAQARAEVTMKAANVTGQTGQDVSEQLTAVWNGYKVTAEETELYVDKLAAVAASTASDLEELSTGMSKVASAANLMGVDVDQLNAQLATIVSVTRQAPESVGVALKTIYARMGDIKAGLDDETTLGNYTEKMAQLGVNVLDTNGNLRDMGEVIEEIGNNWNNLTREQQINLSQTMAGVRQYNNLLSLFDNWNMYTEALNTSANAAGTLQKQQDIYMESTEAHLKKLGAEAERTYDILFNQDTVNSFTDALTGLLSIFNDFLSGLGGGMNDFIFFGSTIANIFNKQIGGAIERQIENIEAMKANVSREQLQRQVIESHAASGDGTISAAAVEKEIPYVEKTLELQKFLTQEQAEQLSEHQREIGLLEQRIQGITQYKDIAEKYGVELAKELDDTQENFEIEIQKQQELYQIEDKRYKNLRVGIEEYSNSLGKTLEKTEEQKKISDDLVNTLKTIVVAKEDEARVSKIINDINKGQKINEEDIKFILEAQKNTRNNIRNIVQELKIGVQGVADAEAGLLVDLQDEQQMRERIVTTTQKQAERQRDISYIVQGLTTMVSLLTTIDGIAKTLSDEDLSGAEKLKQVITTLIGSLPLLLMNLEALTKFLPALTSGVRGLAMTMGAEGVTAASGFGASLAGIASVAAPVIAAVAAIGLAIGGLVYISQEEQREINNLKKEAEELSKKAEETKTTLDELGSSLDKYNSAIETLSKCHEGTEEWNNALQDVNQSILDILEKYPELAKIEGLIGRDAKTGELYIADQSALMGYQQKLSQDFINQRIGALNLSGQANQKEYEKNRDSLLNSINNSLNNYQSKVAFNRHSEKGFDQLEKSSKLGLSQKDLSSLYDVAGVEDLFNQKIQNFADEMVHSGQITKEASNLWVNSMKDNREAILDLSQTQREVNNELKNSAQLAASTALGSGATNVAQRLFSERYIQNSSKYGKDTQGLIQSSSEGLLSGPYASGDDEQILEKIAKAGEISKELADTILSDTFTVSKISKEEYDQIFAKKDEIIEALKNTGVEGAEKFAEGFSSIINSEQWDTQSYLENLKQQFDSTLEEAGKQAAEAFDLDEEAFKDFGEYIADIADESDILADSLETDAKATAVVTQSIMRMNRGVETLADNIDDWTDILNNSSKESYEYWEALEGVRDALADVLDVEKDAIDADFIRDHLDEISSAAEGNAEAIDNLRDAYADQILLNIAADLDFSKLQTTKDELIGALNDIQADIPTLDIGRVDDTDFIQSCQDIINSAGLTVDQANQLFGALGFKAEYQEDAQQTTSMVPTYKTYEKVYDTPKNDKGEEIAGYQLKKESFTIQGESVPVSGIVSSYAMGVTTNDGKNVIKPQIKKLTKKATGGMNNYSSSNAGGGSPGKSSGGKKGGGGGGGGSAKQPDKMDPLEKEKDRYHDIDIQLKQIQTDLDKLDKQKKKLFGQDLITNLNKRLKRLDDQIKSTNEKIKIAKDETTELRNKLSGKGVSFNADGTIANYAQVYQSQLNYVNGLIAQYNSMGAEAQESFKETIEKVKKNFDDFVSDIDRYDEVVTDLIPGLEADIQEAVDEKIDLQIEKFDMEIEIRLNLAEAERDWNDFKKKIIDGIENDDILGNAMAKLVDFSSYYKENDTGIVQALRKQVDNTLTELNQMDKNGWSNVYGDNRTAALDDLKKYYEELMENLEDVLELQEEIHEAYIDMMDEAQDKFDEQIESYEMISDLIEHDMEVISLVYGEESYNQLAQYYNKQQDNFNSQLDFQKQQLNFWRQQLDTLEEGSDAWDSAKEKWMNAVNEWNDLVEQSIENLQDKYLNAINLIFQNLNNKVTDGLGLEYIEEEWNLINSNADQYLDTINSLYEIQKLESKYLDALDQTDSLGAQRQLKEIMDEELANLRERDKLTEYDVERANKRYEIALKQIALQEAQQNKTKMRLRRDSQGNYRYEYTADQNQIGALQDELNDMYNSLYNFDKARYQDNLNQLYSVWAEFQEKMAEAAQINDPVARSERELLLQNQYEQLINGLTEQNATVRENLHESAFDDLSKLYDINVANFQNMSDEQKDVLMSDLLPYWESGVQHMADVFAGEDGFLGVCKDAFEQLHDATQDYEDGLDELENAGRLDFESIGEGIDENIDRTQQLITDNNDLINSYEQEIAAIDGVIGELDSLVLKYNEAKDAAIAATKAAYAYWSEQQRQAAAAANKASQGSGSGSSSSGSGAGSNSSSAGGSGSGKGDGNLVIGETATFSGKYYYDSYGTSPVGSKYSGVANGIIVDRITNNPYGIHIHSADGKYPDLGWIKKSQLSGYDTGGYTGSWGKDGKVALLHEKELVLNKEDTENMLNAISIMRNITNMIGSSVLGKMAAATAGKLDNNIGKESLEQNVHIDAQFPNVKDSREIEEALNNLVNMASMRANRR